MLLGVGRTRGAFHAHEHFPMAMVAEPGVPKSAPLARDGAREGERAVFRSPRPDGRPAMRPTSPMTTGRAPLPPRVPQAPAPVRKHNATVVGIAPPANPPVTGD